MRIEENASAKQRKYAQADVYHLVVELQVEEGRGKTTMFVRIRVEGRKGGALLICKKGTVKNDLAAFTPSSHESARRISKGGQRCMKEGILGGVCVCSYGTI